MADDALIKKLRLTKPAESLVINGPPEILERLGPVKTQADGGSVPFVLLFVLNRAELVALFPEVLASLNSDTVFWTAYPKKSSPLASDINRDAGWEPLYAAGYGPVSAVAIDSTFSALRWRPEKDVKRKEGSVISARRSEGQ